ncbi:MAG: hypothetical protein OXJ54_11130 [Gemmatimonadetes bacterium]|nr:hypothetical protein [Candidatus Palauibacter rhopaloidicola]
MRRGGLSSRRLAAAALLLLPVVSCESQRAEVPSPAFEDVFELVDVIELGEDPSDSIADLGEFFERRDGGFVIGDRFLPRVRTYREDGSLEAAFGRFGDGPWEFRRIRSVAELTDGRIVVTGAQSGALTFLAPDLTPHSMLLIENYVPGTVLPMGPDIVFGGIGRDVYAADMDGLYHRLVDGIVTWSSWNTLAATMPYWNALGRAHAAVGGDSVYAMAGLLYPATILNAAGDSVGTIGTPSPGFRRVPELEPGALAFTAEEGPGAQAGDRIKRLIESFDLVTSMDIVDGNRLVFTVGRLDPAKPWFPFEQLDVSLEAYDRHTGQKLFENVRLPEDSKVLGGGRYLYVLLSPRIPPWRIARYKLYPP